METKFCCEEMKEFMKSVCGDQQATNNRGIHSTNIYFEKGKLDEIDIGTDINLIFRFCPYCGEPVKDGEIKKTKNNTFNKVVDLVFRKDLDEQMSFQAREALLDETISELKKVLKASADLVDSKN